MNGLTEGQKMKRERDVVVNMRLMERDEDEWRTKKETVHSLFYRCQETGQPPLSIPLSVKFPRLHPSHYPARPTIYPKMVIRDGSAEINAK